SRREQLSALRISRASLLDSVYLSSGERLDLPGFDRKPRSRRAQSVHVAGRLRHRHEEAKLWSYLHEFVDTDRYQHRLRQGDQLLECKRPDCREPECRAELRAELALPFALYEMELWRSLGHDRAEQGRPQALRPASHLAILAFGEPTQRALGISDEAL